MVEGWPNAEPPKPDPEDEFLAPKPAKPPVEGTEPKADGLVELDGLPNVD
jgi:hypothetical protein